MAATIGIVGGGQLARMMIEAAHRLGLKAAVLDPDPQASAAGLADKFLLGSTESAEDLKRLAAAAELLTLDIEKTDAAALASLGKEVYPRPQTLAWIQDKFLQKQRLAAAGIAMPRFWSLDEAVEALRQGRLSYPFMLKKRRGAYDGHGNFRIRSEEDFAEHAGPDCYVEELVDIDQELAILVARDREGRALPYPVTSMEFDERRHINTMVIAPADVPPAIADELRAMALTAAKALDGVGILGLEAFWARDGRLLYNEICCRPHNSGHYANEGCEVSQFENHMRAVAGLPLVEPRLKAPTVMVNLLGAPGAYGKPFYVGVDEARREAGFTLTDYAKPQVRPFRKMGHFTIVDSSPARALERARHWAERIEVIGTEMRS